MHKYEEQQEEGKADEEEPMKNEYRMNLTELSDQLLQFVSRFVVENEMDPLPIMDIRHSFRIVGPYLFPPAAYTEITYSFSSGLLYYLSELERHGTIIVAYRDKVFSIDANVAFDNLLFSYDYYLKAPLLQRQGKLFAKATSIWASIVIDFNILSYKFILQRLELKNIESIRIFLEGNTLIGRAIASIVNVALLFVKNALIEKIEEQATMTLRQYFEQLNEDI
ncbi:unnamed protein product [Xylocopa violacea]|uniref:Uncharacterized protein n=1 Tax=Xylocopa violacea TaxID=135666 RepID=A0ABP1NP89_XYLVO